MVYNMDRHIGSVLDYLGSTGELDNIFVFFMSDHGAEGLFMEAYPVIQGYIFAHIAKYYDHSLDNIGNTVREGPCAADFAIPTAASRAGAIGHSFATVMDIAQTQHGGTRFQGRDVVPVQGKSRVPYLSDSARQKHVHDEDKVTGWELFDRQAVRKGNWKAILIPKPYRPGIWQLYDLIEDPGQTMTLSAQEPAKLEELLRC